MAEVIKLDLAHREVVRAVIKDSRVTCTNTSAPDVYVNAITPADTQSLHLGDSCIVPKVTRVRVHLFRVDPSPALFSAQVEIAELPDDPKPLSETISLDQNKREIVRGIRRDSTIKCTKTSAPDVFIKTIDQQNKTSTILRSSRNCRASASTCFATTLEMRLSLRNSRLRRFPSLRSPTLGLARVERRGGVLRNREATLRRWADHACERIMEVRPNTNRLFHSLRRREVAGACSFEPCPFPNVPAATPCRPRHRVVCALR